MQSAGWYMKKIYKHYFASYRTLKDNIRVARSN